MGLPGVTMNRSHQKQHAWTERGAPGRLTVFVIAKEKGAVTVFAYSLQPI